MDTETAMTVGEVAELAGLTVRTLRHYDEIGLVTPSERTAAGYRLYGNREVEQLQEVLFFRKLGFGLEEIKTIVDRPGYGRVPTLARQQKLLEAKVERLLVMIEAIDAAVAAEKRGTQMRNEDMLDVFGGFDPSEYEEETKQGWGDTDAYKESARRTARYIKMTWEQINSEAGEIDAAFIELMDNGTPADGAAAMAVTEQHRAHITKWFYECTPEIHAGLGQVYVTDRRFAENIDEAAPGLARYMSDAIAATSRRL